MSTVIDKAWCLTLSRNKKYISLICPGFAIEFLSLKVKCVISDTKKKSEE